MKRYALVALFGGLLATSASGQELTGTLKKIKETGAITLGFRDSSVPFSYLDDKQRPVGYAMDICAKIVDAVKAELKLEKLEVKLNPVTSATRIPLMANGTIDLECGSTTNNFERQKQVAYTNTHFLTASHDAKALGLTILPAKDHAEAFLMVETDRAVAFIMDDILLASLIASSKDPKAYAVSADAFSLPEPYGIMVRKDDPAFKKVADAATSALFKSPEGTALYAKWFTSAIPPKGLNLNAPMTAAMKKQFANPSDSADPAAY
jgi:glutamate/aspartate transport system substrate-binding protein